MPPADARVLAHKAEGGEAATRPSPGGIRQQRRKTAPVGALLATAYSELAWPGKLFGVAG